MAPLGAPGLYVHVPFCVRVCPYCDFAVQTGGPRKRAEFVGSLLDEIGWWATAPGPWTCRQPFDSVYVGGGTPSALAPEALQRIFAAIRRQLAVTAAAEITLEANPEDVTAEAVDVWRDLGVTRLSLGVQSFDDRALRFLGRTHTAAQAGAAAEKALAAGFDAVSLDLIFAVPTQSPESWRATLQRALDLQPHHISCYELTVHPQTRFFRARQRGSLVELSDDAKAARFFDLHRMLADAGYAAYEVSNFARAPEHRSCHNAKYWDHTPYLGLGPSAHSFDGKDSRWWNARRLIDWRRALAEEGSPIAATETLAPAQLVLEALALGLRTTAGLDLGSVRRRYGVDLRGANGALLERLVAGRLLRRRDADLFSPTLEGMAVADALAAAFEIPGESGAP